MSDLKNDKLDFLTANIIKLKLKPAMKKSFEFTEVYTCKFEGDQKNDELRTIGWGKLSNGEEVEITSKPQKLSENTQAVDLFLGLALDKLKEIGIEIKETIKSNLEFDFLKNKITTVVYFIDVNNNKGKKTITTDF